MVEAANRHTRVPEAWVRRYLAFLGVARLEPDLDALSRLVRAHHAAVTFSNATAILRRWASPGPSVPPIDPEALLGGWERGQAAGVCFESAEMFGRLIGALGFRTQPVLAQISFPGSHQALLVSLADGRYLVDVGCGAPLFEPISLSQPVEVRRAGLAYRFRADDASETWVQERWVGGVWAPFCRYALHAPRLDQRQAAYQRHHTPGQSWVVGTLRLVRCEEQTVYALRGDEFTRFTREGKCVERVAEPAAYAQLGADVFKLPGSMIEQARLALVAFAGSVSV